MNDKDISLKLNKKNKHKFIFIFSLMFLAIALMGTGVVLGIFISEKDALEDTNQATVTKIAVVNADIGIEKNGRTINYASDFMSFPNKDFLLTGYTDGEQGLYYDKYAAVILIPTTFSSSIESINGIPQKTQINYKLNPNLRADIRIKTEKDVSNFITMLSNNISYVYVDSILTEVHEVQDQSESIMANDKKDLNKILGIAPNELIAKTDFVPIEIVDKEITPMNLSDNYSKVGKDVEGITSGYTNSVEKARKDLADIKENEKGLTDAINSAMNGLADANPFKDTGNLSDQIEGVAEKGRALNNSILESKQEALRIVSGNAVSLSHNDIYTNAGSFREALSANGINTDPVEEPYNYMYDIQEAVYELALYFKDSWTSSIANYDLNDLGRDLSYVSSEEITRTNIAENRVKNISISVNSVSDNSVINYENESLSQNTVSENEAQLYMTMDGEEKTDIPNIELTLSTQNTKNLIKLSNDLGELAEFTEQNQIRMEFYAQRYNNLSRDNSENKKISENISKDITKTQKSVTDCLGKEGTELISSLDIAHENLADLYNEVQTIKDMAANDERVRAGNKITRTQARNDVEKIWKLLNKYREASMGAINTIEINEEDMKAFNDAVTDTGKSISDSFSSGSDQYGKACESFSKAAQDFVRLLFEYDALKYMDSETQSAYLKDMYKTITDMEKSIVEQDAGYTEYVLDVNKTALENTTNLQKNIDEKNKETSKNIEEMTEDLKESRTKLNEDNKEILTGITNKLPYTRLGTLNYTQVYSMVSDPIIAYDDSDATKKAYMDEIKIGLPRLLTIMGMITIFITFITLVSALILTKDKKIT